MGKKHHSTILNKKSWATGRWENIVRVKRDERNAQEEADAARRRAEAADQEARLELLRARVRRQREGEAALEDASGDVGGYRPLQAPAAVAEAASHAAPQGRAAAAAVVDSWTSRGVDGGRAPERRGEGEKKAKKKGYDAQVGWSDREHINFFKDIEEGQTKHGRNADREAEKKKEQEAWEKKVGILQYLGQTVYDRKGDKPWYEKRPGEASASGKSFERHAIHKARQADLDPLKQMEAVSKERKKKEDQERQKEARRRRAYGGTATRFEPPKTEAPGPHEADSDASLRRARLGREQLERDRVAALLATAVAGGPTPPATPSTSAKRRPSAQDAEDHGHRRKKSKKHKHHKKERHDDARRTHQHKHAPVDVASPYASI